MRRKIIHLSFAFLLAASFFSIRDSSVLAAEDDITGIKLEREMRDLINRDILYGISPGVYQPGKVINRGEFTALISRALNLPEVSQDDVNGFPDVSPESKLADDIYRASSVKIVQGYENGNFGIYDPVTREQMAQIIDKSLEEHLNVARNKAPLNFSDANEIREEFKDAVSHNVYDGIILGFTNGEFQPKKTATRAEAAAFISRMIHTSEVFHTVNKEEPTPVKPVEPVKPIEPVTPAPDTSSPTPAPPVENHTGHEEIIGQAVVSAEKMALFVKSKNPTAQDIDEIAHSFIEIGNKYNIRGDIAFAQAILETGWFKFDGGTAVTPDQHNYGGLGVTSKGIKGHEFSTVKEGVSASIQHLFAYASKDQLPAGETIVDPRFTLVSPRGKAPHWEDLSGRWAADKNYGTKILNIYEDMKGF